MAWVIGSDYPNKATTNIQQRRLFHRIARAESGPASNRHIDMMHAISPCMHLATRSSANGEARTTRLHGDPLRVSRSRSRLHRRYSPPCSLSRSQIHRRRPGTAAAPVHPDVLPHSPRTQPPTTTAPPSARDARPSVRPWRPHRSTSRPT
jgi:hypothetical protein